MNIPLASKKIGKNLLSPLPFLLMAPIFILQTSFAKADDSIHKTLVKLRTVYWDEVTRECRNETGSGVLVQTQDAEGKERYAVLTASHVSQGASIEGFFEANSKKSSLTFRSDPNGVSVPAEQRQCSKNTSVDTRLARLADNDSDLEFIELDHPPEGAHFFKFSPKDELFCIDFMSNDLHYLATSATTLVPLQQWIQKKPVHFSPSIHSTDDLMSHYSLQFGPRYVDGTIQNLISSNYENAFDSQVVNGMSGSPNLTCEKSTPTSPVRRCCIDGIVKSFHRYFPRTFTSTRRQINELLVSFFEKEKRGLIEPSSRWSYQDGSTILKFAYGRALYEEANLEFRNSGGGDSADSGDSDRKQISTGSRFIPGIKRGNESILGFELDRSKDRGNLYFYANRSSLRDINLFASLFHAKIRTIPYPPAKGELLKLLESRLENLDSELSTRIRRQLRELRRAFDQNSQFAENDDRACFVDMQTLQSAQPEIRLKILHGLTNGQPSYIYLRANSEGILNAVYDPAQKSCESIKVKPLQALFPIKVPDRQFNSEIQISLRGLFFNDLSQTSDMIAHHNERVFWIYGGLPPEDLYSRVPYVVVQLGKDQRDWTITCFPDNSRFNSEFPPDLDFHSCSSPVP